MAKENLNYIKFRNQILKDIGVLSLLTISILSMLNLFYYGDRHYVTNNILIGGDILFMIVGACVCAIGPIGFVIWYFLKK